MFNIEGGCYAKCIDLSRREGAGDLRRHPLRHGAGERRRRSARRATSITPTLSSPRTRAASYPIEFIPNAKIPCVGGHPQNIILLTCDAFGVLPPVSKLTPEQAMYHFISGYTAKVAGTEVGVKEPRRRSRPASARRSSSGIRRSTPSCWPRRCASTRADAWLVNTGWTGGAYGIGSRMKLAYTRAIIDAIHSGELAKVPTHDRAGLRPVDSHRLPRRARRACSAREAPGPTRPPTTRQALHLAKLFQANFAQYADQATAEVRVAGPKIGGPTTTVPSNPPPAAAVAQGVARKRST